MGLKELGKEGGGGDAMSHLFPAQNTVDSRASHLMDIPFRTANGRTTHFLFRGLS